MIERVVAPVIPRSASGTSSRPADPTGARGARTLPLAVPPPTPAAAPVDVIYGMGRIDASGRVALTGTPGVILARRDPAGMLTLGRKPYVTIPAVLRTRCGLQPSDRVLLAATLDDDLLAVYPLSTLHQAIGGSRPVEGGVSR